MAEITIKEAVAGGWAARATIYRAISRGEITTRKAPDGKVYVDVSELVRVFGEPKDKSQPVKETDNPQPRQEPIALEIAVLKERLASLERDCNRLEASLKEAQERESWFKGQLERQTTVVATVTDAVKGGLWRRLFGPKGDG